MPIDQAKVTRVLNAISAKDVPAITAAQVDIPFLSRPYMTTQLQAWLNKRASRMDDVQGMTDAQAISLRTTLYNGLNASSKTVADAIIARTGNIVFPSDLTSANYDRLIGISLITFVLS